eukprot:scaffold57815_cov53-Cyclotella_meneghiniana.AAC.1
MKLLALSFLSCSFFVESSAAYNNQLDLESKRSNRNFCINKCNKDLWDYLNNDNPTETEAEDRYDECFGGCFFSKPTGQTSFEAYVDTMKQKNLLRSSKAEDTSVSESRTYP